MSDPPDLFSQQRSNRRKSAGLVAGFVLFVAWVGFGGDWALHLATAGEADGAYRHTVPWFGLVLTAFAAGFAAHTWRFGAAQVLRATGAWELVEPSTPRERQYLNVVEEMAIAAGLPRPRACVVPDPDLNAFATGRDPATAAIAVTQGALDTLTRDELQGVVAHELAHVRNYDVRLMTLLAAMIGAVALFSDLLARTMGRGGIRVGGRGGSGRRGDAKGGGALVVAVFALWVITLIVAPVVTRLIAMGVNRKREFLADATAAQLTRNPAALASALEKIDASAAATKAIPQGTAHLCIVDPGERKFAEREGVVGDLFASHPPIRVRIARLRAMAYQQVTAPGTAPLATT